MYFGLSEDQIFFQENVSKFLADHAPLNVIKKIADDDNNEMQTDIERGLVNLGLNSLVVPENYGGLGLDLLFAAAIAQSLGEGVAPISYVGSYIMAPIAISEGGSETQKQKYLPKIVDNSFKFGIGLSEYIGSRDGSSIQIKDNKISGRSLFVLDAKNSSHIIFSDSRGKIGICNSKDKGLKIIKLVTVDKTRSFSEIQLDNVDIEILEKTKSDQASILKSIDAGRIILAADSIGASQALINKAVAYSKERKQFGRVIGSFQAVKHMCAEMTSELEPCYALTWHAAHIHKDITNESRVMACHAKSHVSEVSKLIAKIATEVHGGMGFTDLMGIHYWFKRIGVNRQLLGSPELIREESAKIQDL